MLVAGPLAGIGTNPAGTVNTFSCGAAALFLPVANGLLNLGHDLRHMLFLERFSGGALRLLNLVGSLRQTFPVDLIAMVLQVTEDTQVGV